MASLRFFLLSLALPTLAACTVTPGTVGEQGKVRFSQIVSFSDTKPFAGSVVVGATLFVALEQTGGSSVADPPVQPNLTVRANAVGHDGKCQILPLGFGQFAVAFGAPGAYDLVAQQGDAVVDTLSVTAGAEAGLRLGTSIDVATTGQDGGRMCTTSTKLSSLHGFVLHPNQRVTLSAVPVSKDGAPMMGMLQLTAQAPDSLVLDAPLVGASEPANTFELAMARAADVNVHVAITDSTTGHGLGVDLVTSSAPAPVSCN